MFYSPFIPDADEPTEADDSNEPYVIYYEYLLSKANADLPQVISNSYGDDEQVKIGQKSILTTITNNTPDCAREIRQTSLQSDRLEHLAWIDYNPLFRRRRWIFPKQMTRRTT